MSEPVRDRLRLPPDQGRGAPGGARRGRSSRCARRSRRTCCAARRCASARARARSSSPRRCAAARRSRTPRASSESTLRRSGWLSRSGNGFVPGLGTSPELLAAAFVLEPGKSSPRVFEVADGFALVQVLERKEADPARSRRARREEARGAARGEAQRADRRVDRGAPRRAREVGRAGAESRSRSRAGSAGPSARCLALLRSRSSASTSARARCSSANRRRRRCSATSTPSAFTPSSSISSLASRSSSASSGASSSPSNRPSCRSRSEERGLLLGAEEDQHFARCGCSGASREELLADVAIFEALERVERIASPRRRGRAARGSGSRANRSPGAPPRGSGTPLPRRRRRVPLSVPGGIVSVARPSSVGTSTFAPRIASVTRDRQIEGEIAPLAA